MIGAEQRAFEAATLLFPPRLRWHTAAEAHDENARAEDMELVERDEGNKNSSERGKEG